MTILERKRELEAVVPTGVRWLGMVAATSFVAVFAGVVGYVAAVKALTFLM